MNKFLDPLSLGLPSRTTVEKINSDTLAIVIKRKSRIIMADGKKILSKVAQIKIVKPGINVILKTTAPICSKTSQLLEKEGVEIIKC